MPGKKQPNKRKASCISTPDDSENSSDISSTSSSSSSCNNSVATQTSHSSHSDSSGKMSHDNFSLTPTTSNQKKKKRPDHENKNVMTSSKLATLEQPDTTQATALPFIRQSMLMSLIFFLGIYTGVAYVGWVQLAYGFGVDPVREQRFLPYGPSTLGYVRAPHDIAVAPSASDSTSSSSIGTSSSKKSIQLNRDNQKVVKPVVSTLFGVEYDNVVGKNKQEMTMPSKVLADEASTVEGKDPDTPQVSLEWYRLASTPAVSLSSHQTSMVQDLASKSRTTIPNLPQRAKQVSWGGPQPSSPQTNWWQPDMVSSNHNNTLSKLDGGNLLHSYLRIMKWESNPHFPFRLCGDKGCPPERAIAHSLEWREKYKPWLVPPTVLQENVKGYSYHRGLSPGHNDDKSERHATVWLRLGHTVKNDLAFFRGILHSADRAIADALVASQGQTGKFNVIIDCQGFSLSGSPAIASLKQGVTMLQDHYPNRLGMIFLVHLSRAGQIMLNIILALITKEVRDKIKVLPNHNPAKSMAILKTVVEEHSIPDWLGGTDTYRFSLDEYYPPHHRCSEEEAAEFLTSMPYHQK